MKSFNFPAVVLFSLIIAISTAALADDWFLQASHAGSEVAGPRFLVSADGLDWKTVNGDESMLKPTLPGVFRDASIARGKDGTYHMVWTIAWNTRDNKGIGYAHSKDLIHWSEQRIIPVMENEPKTEFVWAPEICWNDQEEKWLIHWASSVTGKFPETLSYFNGRANGRIYYIQTTDFKTFEPSKLLFNPNCLAIDSYLYKAGENDYRIFFKADRLEEPRRGILIARAEHPTGPYVTDPQMVNPPEDGWIEGPSAINVNGVHRLYYTMPQGCGLYETTDFKTWTNRNKDMKIVPGYRHGTIIRIPESDAKRLLEYKPESN